MYTKSKYIPKLQSICQAFQPITSLLGKKTVVVGVAVVVV